MCKGRPPGPRHIGYIRKLTCWILISVYLVPFWSSSLFLTEYVVPYFTSFFWMNLTRKGKGLLSWGQEKLDLIMLFVYVLVSKARTIWTFGREVETLSFLWVKNWDEMSKKMFLILIYVFYRLVQIIESVLRLRWETNRKYNRIIWSLLIHDGLALTLL